MFVYIIRCAHDGKCYVGKHVGLNLQKYLRKQVTEAIRGAVGKPYLYRAIRCHGSAAFSIEALGEYSTQEEVNRYEQHFIRLYRTKAPYGYNLTDGGDGGWGRVLSPETHVRMSQAQKGRTFSPEHRRRMSEARHNQKDSMERVEKRAAAIRGRKRGPLSPESIAKISATRRGQPWSEYARSAYKAANRLRKLGLCL